MMLNSNVVQWHGAAIEVLEQRAHFGQVKPAPGDYIDRLAEHPALDLTQGGVLGQSIYVVARGRFDLPKVRTLFEHLNGGSVPLNDIGVEHHPKPGETRSLMV